MPDEFDPSEEQDAKGLAWLREPEMPSGVRLHLRSIAEADELTPEVLRALGQAMEELQKSAKARARTVSPCPHLRACSRYSGSCPVLQECGVYNPPPPPPPTTQT